MTELRSTNAVMAAATSAYVVSIFSRGSLAVAAIPAAEHFGVGAAALGGLVVFQVMVYAAMQIPMGVFLDRFGPRVLLILGSILMMFGQLVVAQAEEIGVAYIGRMLVGVGDAASFVCMIRLVQDWNTSARATRLQMLMTNIGQFGQILAAIPFAILLALTGWQFSFNTAAVIALISGLILFLVIKQDAPPGVRHHDGLTLNGSINQLVMNFKFSGARMCFWIMFVSQSSGTVFALFWGVPFLIKGQGQTSAFSSTMLFIQFALGLLVGWLLGLVVAKRKHLRVPIFLSVGSLQIFSWVFLATLPGRAPIWVLFIVVASISIGAPISMIAMDFSRQIIPSERRGSANGFINVGGHAATFIMMAIAGWVLDQVQIATGSSTPFTFEGFRWAMASQVLVLLLGIALFTVEYRKTQRQIEL
ncbi:MAG: MFS transporter [Micrococcales bacterium]